MKVVSGKYILGERDGTQVLLEDHYVYIDGARIEAVTRDAPAPGQEVIRYEHGLVVPPLIRSHMPSAVTARNSSAVSSFAASAVSGRMML